MDNEYFISINEVSKRLSVPAYTLRYWEKQFPSAIRPTTGAAGRRYYRAETVKKLETIKALLYKHKLTIAGVKKLLHDGKFPESADAFDAPRGAIPAETVQKVVPTLDATDIDLALSLLASARDLLK